jgi:protein involved in polysaccharide export with SLBB domain
VIRVQKSLVFGGFSARFRAGMLAVCAVLMTVPGVAQTQPASSLGGTSVPGQLIPPLLTQQPTSTTQRDATGREAARQAQANVTEQRNEQAARPEPEPPTEFQRLVNDTTGRRVPIFGAKLFTQPPTTFAPVEDVPVGPGYIIGPGDELRIQLSGQVNQELSLTVDRTGSIALPEIGRVHVAGMAYGQLGQYLRQQVGRVYRNFDLGVNMGSLRTIQVFVVGQARRPGTYTVSSLSTLLNALFAGGGPMPQGSLRDIQVKRGGQTITHFDLYDLLLHGDKSKDVPLATGDVIFIPVAGPQVAVLGSVTTPAIYELKDETTARQVMALAGGPSAVAAGTPVRLERIYAHSMRNIEEISLTGEAETQVRDGDILSVNAVIDRFRDAVTLRGNVANPGRYKWHEGMRITDLIPNKDALITRNYWQRRNALGQMPAEQAGYTPAWESPDEMRRRLREIREEELAAARQRQQENTAATTTTTETTSDGTTTETKKSNTLSEQGVTSVGNALSASNKLFEPQNYVILSAPDIDWSYAVVERQSTKDLTTSLIPFNLGKLVIDGDASQNLGLMPGDMVTIFSKADLRVPSTQQTRFVRLEGEFEAPGVYSVLPGETLRGLLKRAGGFSSDAYLYASEFTRESTRRVEQQRLREYADQLEAQISSTVVAQQARGTSSAEQQAAAAATADARAAIARLRAVTPIGRIVLDLKPNSAGADSVPDLALEDGDRFVVPRVPSNVTVEGQVYSANAFVFRPGRRVLDYLKQAGGPDRQADRRRAFVLRADGSVISQQYAHVDRAAVYPGDTIVVPPILDKRAILQRVTEVATIIGQLGFAAAAFSVLR